MPDDGHPAPTPGSLPLLPDRGDAWAVRVSRAVALGEREGLAEFYTGWFDRCYAGAKRATGRDESFCLDVVQDAMVKAASRLRPVRSSAELAAWMQRVVNSCALDRLREEAARSRRERTAVERPTSSPASSDPHDLTGRIAWLEAQLAEGTPLDRDLLRHRLLGGATLDQAAAASGISGPAAHGRLRRLIDGLRRAGKARFGDA